jgi:hypothetical protein
MPNYTTLTDAIKKLLFVLTRTFPAKSATAQTKAFCFFFSKKKALPCFLWVNLQGGWYYAETTKLGIWITPPGP